MGIFWSMVQAPGQREGIRLMKKDMDSPLTTNIAIYDGHLPIDSVHTCSSPEPEPLCWASVERWYKAKEAKKQVVRDGRLRGVLYLPAGKIRSLQR